MTSYRLKHRSGFHILRPSENLGCLGLVLWKLYIDIYTRPGQVPGIFVAWNLNSQGTEYTQFAFRVWWFWTGYRGEAYRRGQSYSFSRYFVTHRWAELVRHHVTDHYRALVADNRFENEMAASNPEDFRRIDFPRLDAAVAVLRRLWGAAMCRMFGCKIEAEDFVDAEYETVADDGLDHGQRRIVDIDGGGVDWYCTRCGRGGRSYF